MVSNFNANPRTPWPVSTLPKCVNTIAEINNGGNTEVEAPVTDLSQYH